jgi:hypothetical protein
LIAENDQGDRTIVIGEPSESNSGIYYMGIEDNHLQFRLTSRDDFGSGKSMDGEILMFPRDTRILNLWGSVFEVLEASPDEIRCRVSSKDPPTSI